MQNRKPITAKTLAEYFGVTVETVNRWVREERIPFVRVSRRVVRFHLSEVERCVANTSPETVR